MKIKKVNELKTSLSEEELNNWRLEEFNLKAKYRIWAESLNGKTPWYHLLTSCQTLEECANYYNTFNKIVLKEFDNIILTEDKTILLDIESIANSKKYNL